MPVSLALLLTAGVMIACGVYLFLERTLTRVLLGFVLAGNGVNLLFIVAAGRPGAPPFEGDADPSTMTDPLPFAMVLTAIVITLGVSAFVLALAYRAWQLFGHDEVPDDVEDRRVLRRRRRRTTRREQVRAGAARAGAEGAGAEGHEAEGREGAPDHEHPAHLPATGGLSEGHRQGALARSQSGQGWPTQPPAPAPRPDDDTADDADDPVGADLSSARDAPLDHTESDEEEETR